MTAMIEDNILTGASDLSWDVIDNANGVEVGVVSGINTINIPNVSGVVVAEHVIAFQVSGKLIVLEVVTPKEFENDVMPSFDDIIDTIKTSIP